MKNFNLQYYLLIFILTSCKPNIPDPIHRLLLVLPKPSLSSSSNTETVATPVFSPIAGHYSTPQTITLSTTTSSATIYYTIDGTDPTTASTVYNSSVGHIWAMEGRTLKAIAVKTGATTSSIATAMYSYPTLKTGQTATYYTNDDGATQTGVVKSYTDNGDETITDNSTGLIWQKCSRGLSGTSCGTGGLTQDSATNQISYCSSLSLAGKTWRLPSRNELYTLIDVTNTPRINSTYFPNTASLEYRTSEPVYSNPTNYWVVHFGEARIPANIASTINRPARCVSGQSRLKFNLEDLNDGTIKDKVTSLIWQKCSNGQTNDSNCTGTPSNNAVDSSHNYCNSLTLAGRTWRLPNVFELDSIVDLNVPNPALQTSFFPNNTGNFYWTSTDFVFIANSQFGVFFSSTGSIFSNLKTDGYQVRCVSRP
ncbi:MAG: DUF1566 domain-containing protein [Leptospiraceae bacterium]|nr:DUF1566 domain-containing protein [Leptospiraceae bacterium]